MPKKTIAPAKPRERISSTARKNVLTLGEHWRARIKVGVILNRLQSHVKGSVKMQNSQVRAALGLLAKVLPDLQTIDVSASVTVQNTVRAEPLSAAEFEAQFCRETLPETKPLELVPALELQAIKRELEPLESLDDDDEEDVQATHNVGANVGAEKSLRKKSA